VKIKRGIRWPAARWVKSSRKKVLTRNQVKKRDTGRHPDLLLDICKKDGGGEGASRAAARPALPFRSSSEKGPTLQPKERGEEKKKETCRLPSGDLPRAAISRKKKGRSPSIQIKKNLSLQIGGRGRGGTCSVFTSVGRMEGEGEKRKASDPSILRTGLRGTSAGTLPAVGGRGGKETDTRSLLECLTGSTRQEKRGGRGTIAEVASDLAAGRFCKGFANGRERKARPGRSFLGREKAGRASLYNDSEPVGQEGEERENTGKRGHRVLLVVFESSRHHQERKKKMALTVVECRREESAPCSPLVPGPRAAGQRKKKRPSRIASHLLRLDLGRGTKYDRLIPSHPRVI